jgi:hypothetical protein
MIDDLELTWYDDRVGDLDPSIALPPAIPTWELPVLTKRN